jgi:hypothetical protein
MRLLASALLTSAVLPFVADAACINRYIYRQEGPKMTLTLLTGRLTFQEAKDLSKAISEKKAAPLEWIDEKGKTLARQMGELQVLRPMPVGCDEKQSGSVIAISFLRSAPPSGKMRVKLNDAAIVEFEEQKK